MHHDQAALTQRLDGCLLTDAELAEPEQDWRHWPDPFPAWRGAEESAVA